MESLAAKYPNHIFAMSHECDWAMASLFERLYLFAQ